MWPSIPIFSFSLATPFRVVVSILSLPFCIILSRSWSFDLRLDSNDMVLPLFTLITVTSSRKETVDSFTGEDSIDELSFSPGWIVVTVTFSTFRWYLSFKSFKTLGFLLLSYSEEVCQGKDLNLLKFKFFSCRLPAISFILYWFLLDFSLIMLSILKTIPKGISAFSSCRSWFLIPSYPELFGNFLIFSNLFQGFYLWILFVH